MKILFNRISKGEDMKYRLLFILWLSVSFHLKAQDAVSTTEQLIADIYEQYTAENETEMDYESFYEDLMDLADEPVNLNRATRERLEKMPFLTENQIENILSYVYRFGPMQSIYELQLIDGLDFTDIRRMLPFVRVGDATDERKKIYWQDLWRYGKHELYFRVDIGAETKEGYRFLPQEDTIPSQSTPSTYLGEPFYHSLKYKYHYKDRILLGFTAEKDAGESFFGKSNIGYDFYSFSLQLNDFSKFKTIVVGDFRANFGQGLVLRPEFGMGKSSYVLNISPRTSGLKKYNSTDEYNFFRGVGATVRFGNSEITAFYSNKMIDGDTLNGSFTSIYRTGLHRTANEFSKKNTVLQQVAGSNITLLFQNFEVGLTAVHTNFNQSLEPQKSVYNFFYFSGKVQTVGGIHYRMRWKKLNFFGETAMNDRGAPATLNGIAFTPASTVGLVVLYRYYSPEFDTFFATSFSETSRINNESGVYLGVEIRPFRYWKFSAYADSYKFPWSKFSISSPSDGMDYLFQADYVPKSNLSMFWRLRYEKKLTDFPVASSIMPVIVPVQKGSIRYTLSYTVGNFSFRTLIESNLFKEFTLNWTYGATACQDFTYQLSNIPIRFNFRMQFFDAQSFENRFYTYEKDVLYAFSIPMVYGIGSRYYVVLDYELNKQLSCWFKLAQTVFADDRETVSSGNETIRGNRKTDIRFLLKWIF